MFQALVNDVFRDMLNKFFFLSVDDILICLETDADWTMVIPI